MYSALSFRGYGLSALASARGEKGGGDSCKKATAEIKRERGKKSVGGLQRGGGLHARLGGGERDPRCDCQSLRHLRHLLLSGGARRACRRRSRRRRLNSSRTRPRPGGCSPERGSTPTTASRWCARTRPSSSRRPSPGRCSSRPPPCSSTTRETISWQFLIQIPLSLVIMAHTF